MKTEPLRKLIWQWRNNATATHRDQLEYGQKYALLCELYFTMDRKTRCVGCPIATVHGPECGDVVFDLSNKAEWAIDDWWGDFNDPELESHARNACIKLADALEETLKAYEQDQKDV